MPLLYPMLVGSGVAAGPVAAKGSLRQGFFVSVKRYLTPLSFGFLPAPSSIIWLQRGLVSLSMPTLFMGERCSCLGRPASTAVQGQADLVTFGGGSRRIRGLAYGAGWLCKGFSLVSSSVARFLTVFDRRLTLVSI